MLEEDENDPANNSSSFNASSSSFRFRDASGIAVVVEVIVEECGDQKLMKEQDELLLPVIRANFTRLFG